MTCYQLKSFTRKPDLKSLTPKARKIFENSDVLVNLKPKEKPEKIPETAHERKLTQFSSNIFGAPKVVPTKQKIEKVTKTEESQPVKRLKPRSMALINEWKNTNEKMMSKKQSGAVTPRDKATSNFSQICFGNEPKKTPKTPVKEVKKEKETTYTAGKINKEVQHMIFERKGKDADIDMNDFKRECARKGWRDNKGANFRIEQLGKVAK